MCADIYGVSPHTGRGGWTWYTGAAGWMYRLIVETLLGLHLEVDHLRIAPRVPADWQAYTIHYRFRDTVYHITVRQVAEHTEPGIRVTVDGVAVDGATVDGIGEGGSVGRGVARLQGLIPLVDDGQDHDVEVVMSTADLSAGDERSDG
jgi:cyclic beta-1,2-glucan synthetase